MKKVSYFGLLSIFLFLLLLSCNTDVINVWGDQVIDGSLTKDDPLGDSGYYYDEFYIGWAGSWKFELTSKDGIHIYIDANDPLDITEYFDVGTSSTITQSDDLLAGSIVYVSVSRDSSEWAANNYKASYRLKITQQ